MYHTFVSPQATVSANALIAPGVRIYGPAQIGPRVIVGSNVIIGHPSPEEQSKLQIHIQENTLAPSRQYDEVMDSFVLSPTVIEGDSLIRSGSVVYSGSRIFRHSDIAHNCLIRENCSIGRGTHVLTGTQLMADVRVGNGCRIAGTLCNRTTIGDATSMLGHTVHNYKIGVPGYTEVAPRILKGVIIGRETAVIGDIEVGDFAIVGACSVVLIAIPPGEIWAGNPAKQIGIRDMQKSKELIQRVRTYAD